MIAIGKTGRIAGAAVRATSNFLDLRNCPRWIRSDE
jgi:hypothetical protein